MDKHLISRIEADWDLRREALGVRVDQALNGLGDILEVERQQREGHKSDNLKRSLGSYGSSVFDTSAMSAVLGKSDKKHTTDEKRMARVKQLHQELTALRDNWSKNLATALYCDATQTSAEIIGQAGARMDGMARLYSQLRRADMERRARYRPELHDGFFASFGPQHLDSRELSLCPPLTVQVEDGSTDRNIRVMELLSSGLPIKVLLVAQAPGTHGDLRGGGMEVELLPLSLQTVYVLQTTREHADVESQLGAALGSPRAALISLLWNKDDTSDFSGCLSRAVASREFPVLAYDPDISERFVERFDLSGNNDPEAEWAALELHYKTDGNAQVRTAKITGGEYYAGLGSLNDQFTLQTEEEGRKAHLAEWFALSPTERKLTTPFVYRVNGDELQQLVPSREVLIHCSRRAQIWETLRELSGLHNPHVEAAQAELETMYRQQSENTIAAERQKLADNLASEKAAAVEEAMRNLAGRMLGINGAGLAASGISAAPVSAGTTSSSSLSESVADTEVEDADEGGNADELWIDSAMCTACDECTTINPEIFVYNRNKQAIVKNAAGGPFKDIVKAAEKCSAKIIHPGKPSNPDEKGLDKLIERASKFI